MGGNRFKNDYHFTGGRFNMTRIQERLINAYTTLVMAKRLELTDVPETQVTITDGIESTIRNEVEIKIAEREIEILSTVI